MEIEHVLIKILDITSPWILENVEVIHSVNVVKIEINYERGSQFCCSKCGKECKVHDGNYREWRHLDFMQYKTYLRIKIPRTKCDDCGVLTINKMPFGRIDTHYSFFFERLIMSKSQIMSVSAMSREIMEPDQNLWRVIKYYVSQGLNNKKSNYLRKIAVDEKAYKKGHEYVSIFTDLETGEVIFVTKGRKKEVFQEFKNWLISIDLTEERIKIFSMDMSKSYQAGREKYFPKSEVVFDRFHIKKLLNKRLDNVRKREVKKNNKLVNTKYLWLKNANNLTENQQIQMKVFYTDMNIDTVKAYHQKQFFDTIWSASTSKIVPLLHFWIEEVEASGIKEMLSFVKSLKKNWVGIVNAMKTKITNAVSEGINSTIQLSKFRARGFRNLDNFISCIYLMNSNLKFKFHN